MLTVGSLFSGIGGIEIGFEREGFRTIWFVERDEYAAAVLRKHWPETPIYGDITTLDFGTVQCPDVLTGGFPCQDISNAGKRAGIDGSRSSLWKHYLRAIGELRPRYAVIENVAALTQRGLDVVLADLAQVGYDAEWYNLSASAAGAPHRRERIFIICYPNDDGLASAEERGGTAKGGDGREAGKEQTCESARPGEQCSELADSDGERGQERANEEDREHGEPALPDAGSRGEDVANTCDRNAQQGDAPPQRSCERIIERGEAEDSGINCRQSICGGVEGRGSYGSGEFQGQQVQDVADTESKRWPVSRGRSRKTPASAGFANSDWWAVEPSLGRVAHGIPNRVDRIKCLGNAVVPQVAQVVARAIREYEERKA